MTQLNDFQLLVLEKETIQCSDVAELLGDYTDKELPPTLRARIDSHIHQCEHCQELERSYRLTVELAGQLNTNNPLPRGVQTRLRKALNEKLGLSLPLA
ncbi:MAG: zf-HC2 domain-containing protein [Deltaproteobacteria bacterium]|nr:zf-HC2 domain-containing protein [Deltaproteobacteria bacterium]